MKALITTRFSDPKQIGNTSTEVQLEQCRNHCKNLGWEVIGTDIVEAESAKETNEKRVARLLEFCEKYKGQADFVVFYKIDRVARSSPVYYYIKSELTKKGMTIVSASERLEDSPSGRLTEAVMVAIAQFENEVKKERVNLAMKNLLSHGIWPWKAPGGYINKQTDNGKADVAILDKGCADYFTKIFQKHANGGSVTEISNWLTEKNIKNFKGQKINFSRTYVLKVLQNPFYIGILKPSVGEEYEGRHKPLIDIETFRTCQERINPLKATKLTINELCPLRDNLICSFCGKKMTASPVKGNTKQYYKYYCHNKACTNPGVKSVDKHVIENAFLEFLKGVRPNPERWESVKVKLTKKFEDEMETAEDTSKRARKEILVWEAKKQRVIDLASSEVLDEDDAREQLAKIKSKLLQLKLEVNQSHGEEIKLDMLLSFADNFFRTLHLFWFDADISTKTDLQRAVFPNGVIYSFPGFSNSQIGPLFQAITTLSGGNQNEGDPGGTRTRDIQDENLTS